MTDTPHRPVPRDSRRSRLPSLGLWAFISLACACGHSPSRPTESSGVSGHESTPPAPPPPAGSLVDGRFEDAHLPLSLGVEEGWVANVGRGDGALRLGMEHVATGTRMEVWAFSDGDADLHPRAGCHWTFRDEGAYSTLRVPGPVQVATCTPLEPGGPLVLDTWVEVEGTAFHFETIIPHGRLREGRRAADEILATVRFASGARP